jgi:hypothetical protein
MAENLILMVDEEISQRFIACWFIEELPMLMC